MKKETFKSKATNTDIYAVTREFSPRLANLSLATSSPIGSNFERMKSSQRRQAEIYQEVSVEGGMIALVGCPNPLVPTVCAPVFFICVTSAFWRIHISEKMLCGEA